jgi:cardiolipin synthase C
MLIENKFYSLIVLPYLAILLMLGSQVWAQTSKPNILVIWGDDVGMWNISAYGKLQKEILIESAYFVARDRGVAKARELHDRGIRMRVLTNSLATNDVLAAHAGYAKYREALLASGVELYELRPDAEVIKKKVLSGKSKAALHSKAIVFDRESVFIGSFNLDPRSANLNTEAGLYVESPELGAQVIDFMDQNGDLVWETQMNGMAVRFDQDPETGFRDRFMSGFIGLLPVEQQL